MIDLKAPRHQTALLLPLLLVLLQLVLLLTSGGTASPASRRAFMCSRGATRLRPRPLG